MPSFLARCKTPGRCARLSLHFYCSAVTAADVQLAMEMANLSAPVCM